MASINTLKMQQRTSTGRFSGFRAAEFLALRSDRNWVSYLKWQSDFRFPLRRLHWVLSSSLQTDGNANVSDSQTSSGLYLKILQVKVSKIAFALGLIFFYLIPLHVCCIPPICWVWLCFPHGAKLGLRWEALSVWLLIPWNSLQRYSWDHERRSPYCEKRDW